MNFFHKLCFPAVPNDPLVPTAVLGEDLVLHLLFFHDFYVYCTSKQLVTDLKKWAWCRGRQP